MDLSSKIEQLGLSKGETAVYLAALSGGAMLPKHLAEKAGVKRPTLYELTPKLLEKGLLAESIKGKRKYLVAQDPQAFLERKRADLESLEAELPQLRSLLSLSSVKPRIEVYEGTDGVKRVYQDHLRERAEVLELAGIEEIHPDLQRYIIDDYIPERARRKIRLKMLVCGPTASGPFNVRSNSLELREVRTLSENALNVPLGLDVYGDNVSITLHRADSDPIGLIIRSKEIADALRSIFNFLWSSAKA
jgi:sugar-specific transcriptional regulator TrmB